MSKAVSEATGWLVTRPGSLAEVMELRSFPLPNLDPNEVLVKVSRAALNPVDYKLAALMPSFLQKMPRPAGSDFSGHVVQLGSESLKTTYPWLKEGLAVYGTTENRPPTSIKSKTSGALSTYTILNAESIQALPTNSAAVKAGLNLESGAGLGIAGMTAVALNEHVREGDRVLINGGTTAVGLFAADIAKAKGASFVVATGSGSKIDFLKKRGLDDVVDYRATDAKTELATRFGAQPFDVVLDTVGSPELHICSASFLKPGGAWVNIGASFVKPDTSVFSFEALGFILWSVRGVLPSVLGGHSRTLLRAVPTKPMLGTLRQHLERGEVRPVVDEVFPWTEAPQAYAKLIQGRALGKIVVKVGE